MVLACLVAALAQLCPADGDLLAHPPLAPVAAALAPAPGALEARLASSLRKVVPGSVSGPFSVPDLGAVAAAVRCRSIDREGRGSGCEVVVAELEPTRAGATPALWPAGPAAVLPMRSRRPRVLGVRAVELAGDGLPTLVVEGDATRADGSAEPGSGWVALVEWGSFAVAWGPARVREGDAEEPAACRPTLTVRGACGAARELALGCGAELRRWRWLPARAAWVRARAAELRPRER